MCFVEVSVGSASASSCLDFILGAVSFSHLVATQDSCLGTREKSNQKTDLSLKIALLEEKIANLVWFTVQSHRGCNGTSG